MVSVLAVDRVSALDTASDAEPGVGPGVALVSVLAVDRVSALDEALVLDSVSVLAADVKVPVVVLDSDEGGPARKPAQR